MVVCGVIADMAVMMVMMVIILNYWGCFLLEKSAKNEIPLLNLG
jgi:hypothetical protein